MYSPSIQISVAIFERSRVIKLSEKPNLAREHFPINLTPVRGGDSIESGSPRSKRPRLPSVDSNLSAEAFEAQNALPTGINHGNAPPSSVAANSTSSSQLLKGFLGGSHT